MAEFFLKESVFFLGGGIMTDIVSNLFGANN